MRSLAELFARLEATDAGLTSAESRSRLHQYGANEPAVAQRTSEFAEILALFSNPLVLILLGAGVISGVLGERFNAIVIVVIVLLGIGVNYVQTYRSQIALQRLKSAVAPTASVLRDGDWLELPRVEAVPGDVIRLASGDLVPADARLIQSKDLHVQEAALTGESLPVEKETEPQWEPGEATDERCKVLLGTSVVSGTATALVFATGRRTAFGEIAARLAARPPQTEFERGVRQFGFLIMKTVVFLVLFVFFVTALAHHAPLESLLFAVALAVGLTPEFLPMITSVTLAQGAVRMARKKVIVKHLASMQNFGSIDLLCSDKTGTLTTGKMELDRYLDPCGARAEKVFLFAYVNSFFETGVTNPLDAAILRHARPDLSAYQKLDENPFDFERRRVSVVVARGGERLLIAKGAPEAVLAACTEYEMADAAATLDAESTARCESTYRDLSAKGYRVLAVACRKVPAQLAYTKDDEKDLILVGYLAFLDPPVEDVAETLEDLKRDGVRLKILTGDSELVAEHLCRQVGLEAGAIVLGKDLERISDAALGAVAEETTVFARVSPADKNRVIYALKRRGHVVGFIGDGINDAPSLHSADVGISVATATDIAKDAADVILLEHSLDVLHKGIIEGRKAFGNVIKYIFMGTSSNFGNMFSMAAASVFLPFLPMLPAQILLNNFLYDVAQLTIPTDNVEEGFILKPRRWNVGVIRDFMIGIGPISSLYDFLTFYILLRVLKASEVGFHTGWFVESLVTQTLVLFVIRTTGNPFRSRPSLPLTVTTLAVAAIAVLIPYTPLAAPLGFAPLPALFLVLLAAMTATYVLLVQLAKKPLIRRFLA